MNRIQNGGIISKTSYKKYPANINQLKRVIAYMFRVFGLSGPHMRASAPGPHKIFKQFNFLLFKFQSLSSCAHYFQWFTDHVNHVDFLMQHVHVLKKLPYCLMCT